MKFRSLFMALLSAAFMVGCAEQLPPVETFVEAEDPTPLTAEEQAEWDNVKSGLNGAWATIDSLYSRSVVPQVAPVKTLRLSGWKGERLSAQILLWSKDAADGVRVEVAPLKGDKDEVPTERIQARFVRYTLADKSDAHCLCNRKTDHPAVLVPDMLDSLAHFDMAAKTVRPVWLTVYLPMFMDAGVYKSKITITDNNGDKVRLPFEVEVVEECLKEPMDWDFHLDLWQHPAAVARAEGLELWSDEHFEAIKRNCRLLQAAGQKVITTTLNKDPWNHQCYDAYEDMIKWTLKKDGTWSYDYTIFDKVIKTMMDVGIYRYINCYSMLPWNYELDYFDEAKGEKVTVKAKPGTPMFEKMWGPFLTDFYRHIDEDLMIASSVNIAADEREPEDMDEAIRVLNKYAPDLHFAMADNKYSFRKYNNVRDVCIALRQPIGQEDFDLRHKTNYITTYYVCCSTHFPNTLTYSQPFEAELLPWLSLAKGFDGMLRWAYNSWPENPQYDSRFAKFASGDTYFIYPYARSSIRFERLIDGIEAYEKAKMLMYDFTVSNRAERLEPLNKVLERMRTTKPQDKEQPWNEILRDAIKALDDISRRPETM